MTEQVTPDPAQLELKPGSPEHDAAMIAVHEQKTAPPPADAPPQVAQRPAHVPEKFWDAAKGEPKWDDMAKAYGELEKKLGQKPAAAPAQDPAQATQDDAQKAVSNAGLNFDALSSEYQENGELSAASYEALEKAGIPKAYVDAYIAGQEAQMQANITTLTTLAGGDEAFEAMREWARTGLDPADIKVFDEAVGSGDMGKAKQAVLALKAIYEAENGTRPNLVSGNTSPGVGQGFQSREEHLAAIRDPRYRADPAFRADVERRLALTTAF